jgi:hypothetical protein
MRDVSKNHEYITSLAYVKKWLHYDPDAGYFTWVKKPISRKIRVGDIAGSIKGYHYVIITLGGEKYKEFAHKSVS